MTKMPWNDESTTNKLQIGIVCEILKFKCELSRGKQFSSNDETTRGC